MSTLVDPRELVGQAEAVEITGLSKQSFQVARKAGRAPDPVAVLACGPIWTRTQIEDWTAERAVRRP